MLEKLQQVADFIKREIQDELVAQGHEATGRLKESISVEVTQAFDLISIDGRFVYYGRYVDQGRRAGVKRVPIDALLEWIKIKRLSAPGKTPRSLAFAIQTAIYKRGIPTDGDSRKKRFVSGTLERIEPDISVKIQEIVSGYLEFEFYNMIERTQRSFDNAQAA